MCVCVCVLGDVNSMDGEDVPAFLKPFAIVRRSFSFSFAATLRPSHTLHTSVLAHLRHSRPPASLAVQCTPPTCAVAALSFRILPPPPLPRIFSTALYSWSGVASLKQLQQLFHPDFQTPLFRCKYHLGISAPLHTIVRLNCCPSVLKPTAPNYFWIRTLPSPCKRRIPQSPPNSPPINIINILFSTS